MYEKVLRIPLVCPNCGRKITAIFGLHKNRKCYAMLPRTTPRKKGEPRKVRCNTIMIEPGEPKCQIT